MGKLFDVIGMGCCAFDIVCETDRYPGPDEKIGASAIRKQGGGLVATALVAVARLGGRCAFLGAIGDDYFGQFCVDDFEREGVDTGMVRRVPDMSVVTAVIVACPEAGTRMILATSEENPTTEPHDVTEERIRAARCLHADGFFPAAVRKAADIARSHGIPVTLDLEWHCRGAEELLPVGDYPIVPLGFARNRYGCDDPSAAAEAVFAEAAPHGAAAAVVTAGARGAHVVTRKDTWHQPAYRAPTMMDTTGCGDVFHGAFALGIARGWDLDRVLRYAAAVAALKCRLPGGRAGIPSAAEVEAFLVDAVPLGPEAEEGVDGQG